MASWDLSLFLLTDGKAWNQYVEGQLNGFPKVQHQSILIDELLYENPPELAEACRQSAVTVLIVTPDFVEFIESKAGWFSQVLKQTPPTSCIVCLVLVDEQEVEKLKCVAGRSYANSADWQYFDPGHNVVDVQQTIAKVLDIVETCQAARSQAEKANETAQAAVSVQPMVPPRSMSQPALNTQPKVTSDEEVSSPDAQKEGSAAAVSPRLKKMPPPPTQKKPKNVVQLFPSVLHESGTRVAIVFKQDIQGDITAKIEQSDIELTLERENDRVFTFLAPELAAGKYTVLVTEGERQRGHCSLRVKGLQEEVERVFCSTHYLCQSLQVPDLAELDVRLKDMFSASLPMVGSGLDKIFSQLSVTQDTAEQCESQYPTLLHWAAAHGLSELCGALLESPSSSLAYAIHNCEGLGPAELAAKGGFHELETYISGFMEMQTAQEIYDHYIAMNPTASVDTDSESDGDDYEPMTAYPPLSRSRSQSVPSMPTESPSLPPRSDRPPLPPPRLAAQSVSQRNPGPLGVINEDQTSHHSQLSQPGQSSTMPARLSPGQFMNVGDFQLSKGAIGSRSQHELIEVNEMVKSHEITLNEAHMLFNAWQQRYGKTPSKSFKERQTELTDMQTKYKKLREDLNKGGTSSKSFLTRLGFGSRQNKPTIKLKISDPVEQRNKRGPRVYTKSASTSNLYTDRASSASTASSSSSSRDSGWSQGSRDSHMSSSHECDSERDEVFQPQVSLRRGSSSRDSTKRDSLGHQYLRKAEEELQKVSTPPPLPPRNHSLPPPPS